MKFYRLHKYETMDGSRGFDFFTSKEAAIKARRDWVIQ